MRAVGGSVLEDPSDADIIGLRYIVLMRKGIFLREAAHIQTPIENKMEAWTDHAILLWGTIGVR